MMHKIQILDHGYISLVDRWGSDESIIEAARMSTQKGFEGWGPKTENVAGPQGRMVTQQVAGDEKLLAYLWKNKHETPFEMAGVTIEVQAPIFVFREWHRHRVPFGYNEASARYAPLPDLNYIPTIERLMLEGARLNKQQASVYGSNVITEEGAQDFRDALQSTYEECEDLYKDALDNGIPKELARCILPVGRYSKMRATGNLRGWLGFLKLRMDKHAQWEIRQYANALHGILSELHPRTMKLFDETIDP